jgi:hypothetical protein
MPDKERERDLFRRKGAAPVKKVAIKPVRSETPE